VTGLAEDWEVEETGETLEENASLKALAAVRATGMAAIADDTGLFVDALGGLPGVKSSRYAGAGCTYEDNVRKLLDAIAGVEPGSRGARFRSAIVLACPDGSRRSFEGTLEGSIGERPRGTGGFGYDPVFVLPGGSTLAELSLGEKNRVSHRGAAFRAFAEWVKARGARGICPCGPGVRY
jgi:XTP/dITP diphosphohydrolase